MAKKTLKILKITDLVGELSKKKKITPLKKPRKALWEKAKRVV